MKKTWTLLLILVPSFLVAGSVEPRACGATAPEPVVRVGSEVEFPPFAFVDERGRASGFSVDLIRAVADAAGLRIVITTGTWDAMWTGLASGQLDVLPIVAKLPERQRLVDFSLSHTETFDAFFVRDGSPAIPNVLAAAGKKVVVMRSDAAHHALLERKFPGEIETVDTIPEGLKRIAAGKGDAFLCSKLIGIQAIRKHGIKGLSGGPLIPDYKREFSFAVKKGDGALREKLDQGLLIVKSTGEYDRIYNRWLEYDDPWRKHRKPVLIALFASTVIALAALAWSSTLRRMVKKRTSELAVKNETLEREISIRKSIEDKLHAEEALRSLMARHDAILQGIPDIVMEVDGRKVYTWANPAGFEFFGKDVIGRPADHYFEGEQDTYVRVQPIFDGDESTFYLESWQRRKDGEKRLLAWWCRALKDADGRVTGALSTARDITDRKHAEEEKEQLQTQLQQAMKMEAVGRLAGGVAHDFNNLLTAIIGNVSLAQMKLPRTDPVATLMEEANKAAVRAARLTQQLLAFSRKQIIEPKILDANHLIAGLHAMVSRLIGENIELRIVPGGNLGLVKIDPGQFEQILVNLAINSRDAMPDGGKLLIETSNVDLDDAYGIRNPDARPGRFIRLSVSDTGHGMSEEVKAHIFEPFFTTKPKGTGTGLGLSTIYGGVKQAGGFIEVYSELGKGTTFKIYLPRQEGEPPKPERASGPTDLTHGFGTVLLVEDEETVRDLCVLILERLGYRVLQAGNGTEAIALARGHRERLDLLVTDVVMPGMNGREVAKQLILLHPEMKVLFMSGYTEDAISQHGVLEDGVSFIGKPFSPTDLGKKVREVLDNA